MAEVCNHTSTSRTSSSGGFQRKQSYMFLQKSPKKLFEDLNEEEGENRVPKYHHHFLESCFLCKRRFDGDDDIFMYKGEMAFCSEECREQHMEMDELKERRMRRMKKLSTIKEVSRENRTSSSSHSTTIAVA